LNRLFQQNDRLQEACGDGDIETVRELLTAGVDVNSTTEVRTIK